MWGRLCSVPESTPLAVIVFASLVNGVRHRVMQDILRSIISAALNVPVKSDAPLASQFRDFGWSEKLSQALTEELNVAITPDEIETSRSLSQLWGLVESRLVREPSGRSLVDVYIAVERLAREEYHSDINYHWCARWSDFLRTGNWLTSPDAYDAVELVMRLEREFRFSIPNEDAHSMQTVGQTVRYLWNRSSKQYFTLRERVESVCYSAFTFNELRRLLVIRGGVPRSAVRLSVSLGQLLPTWHKQFWREVQDIFCVSLPQGRLLTLNPRLEKQTTVKELVKLITSYQARQ
jgi:hypothetical protein